MGRIHGAKLTLSGLGHNFWLECTGDLTCAFLNCILKTLFRDTPLARFRWCARCQVPAPGTWIFRCQVLCVRWHERCASGVSLKRVIKMRFRNAYFRSLVHSETALHFWKFQKNVFIYCTACKEIQKRTIHTLQLCCRIQREIFLAVLTALYLPP